MEDEEKGEAKPVEEETISEIKRGNEFSKEKVRPSLGDGIFYCSWVACPAGILMTPQFIYIFYFKFQKYILIHVFIGNTDLFLHFLHFIKVIKFSGIYVQFHRHQLSR